MRRRLAAVVLLVCLGLTSTSAAADEGRGFSSDWECTEALITLPVPIDNVRKHVPAEFDIAYEDEGFAVFAVFAERCRTRIDDGPWIEHILSGAFVQLDSPDPANRPGYEFLWGSDSPVYYKALRNLGAGDFVPGSSLDITSAGGQVNVSEADIPWKESPFSFTLVTGEPAHPPQPTTSIHILDGKKGFVWSSYPHQIEVSGGTGVLQLTPGTLLAAIVGSDTATGAALFGTFTIEDAVTELRA